MGKAIKRTSPPAFALSLFLLVAFGVIGGFTFLVTLYFLPVAEVESQPDQVIELTPAEEALGDSMRRHYDLMKRPFSEWQETARISGSGSMDSDQFKTSDQWRVRLIQGDAVVVRSEPVDALNDWYLFETLGAAGSTSEPLLNHGEHFLTVTTADAWTIAIEEPVR